MGHTKKARSLLIARINRIQGQLSGVVDALEGGKKCGDILQTVASCRGAINGLTVEILEEHIRSHVIGSNKARYTERDRAALDIIGAIRSYVK